MIDFIESAPSSPALLATAGCHDGVPYVMSHIQNLSRKQGTYYFRRQIRLRDDKPFRLRLSLKTTSLRRARILAPALTLISESVAMKMSSEFSQRGLTAAQRREIYRGQMLVERDRLEMMHANLQVVGAEDEDNLEQALALRLDADEIANLDGAAKGHVEDFLVAHFDPEDDEKPILVMTWSDLAESLQNGTAEDAARDQLARISAESNNLNLAMARKAVHQARIQAIREFRSALTDPGFTYPDVPIEGFGNDAIATKPMARHLVQAPSPSRAATGSMQNNPWLSMTPSEAALKFIDHNPRTGGQDGNARKVGKSWSAKTREQFKLPAMLLEQVMTGRPLATITHDDLLNLNSCFNRLHGPTFRKSNKQRALTILEIANATDGRVASGEIDTKDVGLGIATSNRHWSFLRQLTKWFSKQQPLPDLDYSAFIVPDHRNPRDGRGVYTPEQGIELFSLPVWTGCKSASRRMVPGSTIIHDSHYFVPLIGWYTGMRRDEICGLELDDIVFEDGFWHFDVRENDVRALKTIRSKRLIPLAEELIRLGLPDYIGALREAGERLLFPELAAESGKGTMGGAYYRVGWVALKAKLPFLERGQAMQSFRHTGIDMMKAAEISLEVRADFGGHAIASETGGRYSKASRPDILRRAIDTITEVTKHLDPAPINLLPDRLRGPRKARGKPSAKQG